jgi:hypothetical protein
MAKSSLSNGALLFFLSLLRSYVDNKSPALLLTAGTLLTHFINEIRLNLIAAKACFGVNNPASLT